MNDAPDRLEAGRMEGVDYEFEEPCVQEAMGSTESAEVDKAQVLTRGSRKVNGLPRIIFKLLCKNREFLHRITGSPPGSFAEAHLESMPS